MPKILKRNTFSVCGLAAQFWWSFMFAKHDPALRVIIPFGDDPYDAVGSFAVVAGVLLALVSFIQTFRSYRERVPSIAQRVYLIRAQEAIVLVILMTLAADLVAMIRHRTMWISAASRYELVALLAGLAIVAVVAHLVIRASQERCPQTSYHRWRSAGLAVLAAVLILFLYPERLIDATPTHLLTVVIGALVLFIPTRPLLIALVPFDEPETERTKVSTQTGFWRGWGIVLFVGVSVGLFALVDEISEGAGRGSTSKLLYVGSVFIGLAVAGLLIAFASFGELLGLGARYRVR